MESQINQNTSQETPENQQEESISDNTEPQMPTKQTQSQEKTNPSDNDLENRYPINNVADHFLSHLPTIHVLSIYINSFNDVVSQEVIITFSNHFLQLDNVFAKRAIPIGLSLTFASNPNPFVLDILAKLTRNEDGHIAINSIIAIGIVAAGTNNVRAMNILVALTSYYSNDPNAILSIEFAQALIYSGKGLLTASPLNEYNGLINERRLAFLLVFLVQIMMHKEGMLTNKLRELFFTIIPSLYPRWLITLDSDLKPTPVSVRIGKPLDTAGMPGKPKVISSFYSHQAPVILQQTEAAELNTGEYQLFAHTLTGIVLSRKTPPHQLKEANHVVEI